VTEWINPASGPPCWSSGVGYTSNERVRRLCIGTLITLCLGMLFDIVESDWLHVIVAAQMQTWRWLWLLGRAVGTAGALNRDRLLALGRPGGAPLRCCC